MRGLSWAYSCEAAPAVRARRAPSVRVAAILCLLCIGCDNASDDSSGARGASATREGATREDPKRFASELAPWPQRWNQTAALPSCKPLLPPPEQGPCEAAQTALDGMRSANGTTTAPDTLQRAAALALAAQRATVHLRSAGLKLLLATPAPKASAGPVAGVGPVASASASASASPQPKPSSHAQSGTSAHPAVDVHGHSLGERQHNNPHLAAIHAYTHLAAQALRQVAVFLEQGPLDVRQAASTELERLAVEQGAWEALRALAAEAALLERDPDLKRRLSKLSKRPKSH